MDIAPPIIIGMICASIYKLFELFARRKERMAIIEKLSEGKSFGQIEGKINVSYENNAPSYVSWALRGGCLLIGVGLGLIVAFYMLNGIEGKVEFYMEKSIYSGSICLFGGLGLLIAAILEWTLLKKKKGE